jgi:ribosomal protein L11 methyltransferase
LIRLSVRCRPELAERVLADLVELAPGGVEEETGPGWVEYAIYGAPGELPALPDLEAAAGDGLVEVTSKEVPDDWADRWQDFHEAISIAAGRVIVRPSWEPGPAEDPAGADAGAEMNRPSRRRGQHVRAGAEQPAGIDVVVDPGQAFGTGAHPTTRMCLELLVEVADAGLARGPLADLGTGSGVLALAAAKLGFGPVTACDSERAALDAARASADANGVELELARIDLRREAPPAAPTVTANLTAPLLMDVAGRIEEPPERLVCSGMLASEIDEVAAAFADAGLRERERRASGDWAALLLELRP